LANQGEGVTFFLKKVFGETWFRAPGNEKEKQMRRNPTPGGKKRGCQSGDKLFTCAGTFRKEVGTRKT